MQQSSVGLPVVQNQVLQLKSIPNMQQHFLEIVS